MATTIRHGVNNTTLDSLVGKTVGEVREQVSDLLNIPASAQVRVNGAPAGESDIIGENTTVEFVKVAGEKGCA
jgi:hypothetical protein